MCVYLCFVVYFYIYVRIYIFIEGFVCVWVKIRSLLFYFPNCVCVWWMFTDHIDVYKVCCVQCLMCVAWWCMGTRGPVCEEGTSVNTCILPCGVYYALSGHIILHKICEVHRFYELCRECVFGMLFVSCSYVCVSLSFVFFQIFVS